MVSTSVSLCRGKGKTLRTAPAAKGSASQRLLAAAGPTLPHEVDREQREDEQAGVPGVEVGSSSCRAKRVTNSAGL